MSALWCAGWLSWQFDAEPIAQGFDLAGEAPDDGKGTICLRDVALISQFSETPASGLEQLLLNRQFEWNAEHLAE